MKNSNKLGLRRGTSNNDNDCNFPNKTYEESDFVVISMASFKPNLFVFFTRKVKKFLNKNLKLKWFDVGFAFRSLVQVLLESLKDLLTVRLGSLDDLTKVRTS